MTVSLNEDRVIVLTGESQVEDAEILLEHLQAHPESPVDWSGCRTLHTAVVQVLMAAKRNVRGACGDEFVRNWVYVEPSPGAAR
jgi:hypothetical protein